MKKKLIYAIMVLLMIAPIYVKANIKCNDGSESPTCTTCKKGCCSKHGGCTANQTSNSGTSKNSNKSNSGSNSNSSSNNGIINDTSKSNNNVTEVIDDVKETDEKDDNNNSYIKQGSKQNNNVSIVDSKKEDSDSGSTVGGIATLGIIGAIVYAVKKKKK